MHGASVATAVRKARRDKQEIKKNHVLPTPVPCPLSQLQPRAAHVFAHARHRSLTGAAHYQAPIGDACHEHM
jgi:hypothetical protein